MRFQSSLPIIFVSLAGFASSTSPPKHPPPPPPPQRSPPTKYGIIVFPGFQALDVFGPLDILNSLSMSTSLNLSIISTTLDPVSTWYHHMEGATGNFGESIVPTHTFDDPAAKDIEVLLVPGGMGTRAPNLDPHVAFIKEVYPKLRYLITVCTGSALAARSGILDGRRATSNKWAFSWVMQQGPKVKWVAKARWVRDGNIWTTSGIAAGMDGTFDYLRTVYGIPKAQEVANGIEYEPELDWRNDPFAALYNLTDPFVVPHA